MATVQEQLLETIRHNEETARKFFEVETNVLSILNFKDFFSKLLADIRDNFGIPHVWVSMLASSKASELTHTFASSEVLKQHLNIIDGEHFLELTRGGSEPLLVNENLEPYRMLLPEAQDFPFRSLAIVPLSLDGQVVGSLNHADIDPARFMPGDDTSLLAQLGVVVSISLSNVAAHEELRSLAFHDPLTGLLNRRAMEKALRREISRATRYDSPLSLVFVDLDDFKQVNDRYGHDRGDELLAHVANIMRDMSRESDIISRFAGDEFVIILPGIRESDARSYMLRLTSYLHRTPLESRDGEIVVGLSCGIASHVPGDEPESLLKRADQALYEEKAGKHQH